MELWYIARFDIEPSTYFLKNVIKKDGLGTYRWILNRYHAMYFNTKISIVDFVSTYMFPPRKNTEVCVICFKNGEKSDLISLSDFNYNKVLGQIVLT